MKHKRMSPRLQNEMLRPHREAADHIRWRIKWVGANARRLAAEEAWRQQELDQAIEKRDRNESELIRLRSLRSTASGAKKGALTRKINALWEGGARLCHQARWLSEDYEGVVATRRQEEAEVLLLKGKLKAIAKNAEAVNGPKLYYKDGKYRMLRRLSV